MIWLLVAACTALVPPGTDCGTHQKEVSWQDVITNDDRKRIRDWRSDWVDALANARASGHSAEIAAQGALLDPDAAGIWEAPPPGLYRCRTIKLGAQSKPMPDFVAYPAGNCRIRAQGKALSFAMLGGVQRPVGRLIPYENDHLLFLGSLKLGDETRALRYGGDTDRDMVALMDRLSDGRWRLIFPSPHFESDLDIMELVPITRP